MKMRLTLRETEIFEILKKEPLIAQDELARRFGISRSSVAVHISNLMKKGVILGKGYVINESASVVVPVILIVVLAAFFYLFMLNQGSIKFEEMGSGGRKRLQVDFTDIGGQDSAVNELKEALQFVVKPEAIYHMGIRPLRGVLLVGPPGTGKTLMAKAAASYTGSAFMAASGSEFIEVYAGVGAKRIRKLFNDARKKAHKEKKRSAIIFIDELEILGGKRGSHSSHLEYDQTLNQLLVEMDGISSNQEPYVLLIGATNRADMLDPALLRPGRFDRQVQVGLPDKGGRKTILDIHTRNKPVSNNEVLDEIARATFGFSGAHLESLANEAAILALREGGGRKLDNGGQKSEV
jgi:cell division protease FtsH